MKKPINSEHIEGRVYQHDLVIRKVQNQDSENFGKEFISGDIYIAVDEEGVNVIPVHFSYVTEKTKSGGISSTYIILKNIIDNGLSWITDGKEQAFKVRIDTALASNDFYNQKDELVSTMVNENGFVNAVEGNLCPQEKRNTFQTDTYIEKIILKEPDEERNIKEQYLILKGYVFNFKKQIIPVELIVRNQIGIEHFMSMNISSSNPQFIKLWGKINNTTTKITKEEETAFGEKLIVEFERKSKEWIVTGMAKVPYDFGDENVLTEEEITKASQDREVMLAEKKKRREDWLSLRDKVDKKQLNEGSMHIPDGGFPF